MANKHLTRPPTEVLRARLNILLKNTNELYKNGGDVLEEDLVSSYQEAMNLFMESLDSSLIPSASKIKKGLPADPLQQNIFSNAIERDLEALFAECGALDRMVTSGFNSIISEREEALQASKRVSNKIGDYLLFADPSLGAGYFFGDSFNSAERIESGSSLLEGDECLLAVEEGAVLLPLDGTPTRPKVKNIIINDSSNGNPGNEFQVDTLGKSEIAAISDSEPNTWYEYEKVSAYESDTPLVLDLTLTLEEIYIVNHIHLNPINFGFPSPIKIASLETSQDGQEYRSILDEVPVKDYIKEDKEEAFSLSPATSKFSGQGFYSFLPRRVQFVHIVLVQETPYAIKTLNGERLRYAIGLRDINVLGRKFKAEGSLISTPFDAEKELRKVSIWTAETPTPSSESTQADTLAKISHSLSENDGATWRDIQPTGKSELNIAEVINYNNIATGSIVTDEPVTALRHKITMKRDVEAFQGDVVVKRERISFSELVSVPAGNPDITLSKKPIKESVRSVIPFFGSYSCPLGKAGVNGRSAPMDLDFLEFSVDVSSIDNLRFELPYLDVPNIREHIRLFINREQWEFCEKEETVLDEGHTSYHNNSNIGIDENSKIFFLNKGGRELQFGHNVEEIVQVDGEDVWQKIRKGALPPGGAKIQICMDGDNPRLELTDKGYVLNLTSNSDGFKDNVSIVSVDAMSMDESVGKSLTLTTGLNIFALPLNTIGKRDSAEDTMSELEKVLDSGKKVQVSETKEGLTIPVVSSDPASFSIKEIRNGKLVQEVVRHHKFNVPFIDGNTEFEIEMTTGLLPDINEEKKRRYSFDYSTGTLHLGRKVSPGRTVTFHYEVLKYTDVPTDGWKFYQSEIGERINTSKLILDPKYVRTMKRKTEIDVSDGAVYGALLIDDEVDSAQLQPREHGWYKQRLVKGTVVLDQTLFDIGVKPTETVFVDGHTELKGTVNVEDEVITDIDDSVATLHTFTLKQINKNNIISAPPGFASVRSLTSAVAPVSQFKLQASSPATLWETPEGSDPAIDPQDHNWAYEVQLDGTCKIYLKLEAPTTMIEHVVDYNYTIEDPGIDRAGLYSIDYENGVIHFAEGAINNGNIDYEVSTYSAFYNIADIIKDGDIKEINEEEKKITVSDSLSMKLLKQSSALKARPAYIRMVYDYYKETTESLADLEPYYSPVCKDIAVRAVTADLLEEL